MSDRELTVDRSVGTSLRSGFERRAQDDPDALALTAGKRSWSYGELDDLARRWAGALIGALAAIPRRIGVLGYRSETSYAGTLAALYAGAAFVPLNPNFPPARTEMMIRLADLDALIVEARFLDYLKKLDLSGPGAPLVIVSDGDPASDGGLGSRELGRAQPLAELPPVLGSEMAYLMFTSGSTGVPKGVPVVHANVVHFLEVMQDRYHLLATDRLSQTFDQTFDLSVFDLFMAWQAGASAHVPSQLELVAPTSFINRQELTLWFSVPSIPALMRKKNLLAPGSLPTLRWSLFCGEPLPMATAQAWQDAAPGSVLENLYGPTELTIACFVHRWDRERSPGQCVDGLVPIGRPYPGLGAIVVDDDHRPVADGEAGELLVCGPQTVPGYWRAPEKTAERFHMLPVALATATGEELFYATGDRVLRTEHGEYTYRGRTDHQIKVLGYRVELGDVEAVLRDVEGLVEAVAIGWPVEDGVAQGIVAFATGTAEPDETIAVTRSRLPKYMVPARVEIVDRMPLNANGKIDRNALRDRLSSGDPAVRG